MATSLQTIQEYLSENEIEHHVKEEHNHIQTGTATRIYRDENGNYGVHIIIALEEDGEFVRIIVPNLYHDDSPDHLVAILQTCMQANRTMKMVQFEYDASDGEIRLEMQLPLEDAKMTKRQLMRMLGCVIEAVDDFDAAFRAAIERGEVIIDQLLAEQRKKAKLAQLVNDATGEDLDRLIQQLEFSAAAANPPGLRVVRH